MNYQIIRDEHILKDFINWLPDLKKDETFYCCLFARKKYDENIVSDKLQLKRFTSDKERLIRKLRQLECKIGSYKDKSCDVTQKSLAVYIMINPRSYKEAINKSVKDFSDMLYTGEIKNPHKTVLTNLQKSSNKRFMIFDFDNIKFVKDSFSFMNDSCLTFLKTRSGFHIIVSLKDIDPEYKKSWYSTMTNLECIDVKGDVLSPIPGCVQSEHIPYIIPFSKMV